jgi:plastocyanin
MRCLKLSLLVLSLAQAAACGSNSPSGPSSPVPPATPNDVQIVKGASLLTTTAFNPNPKALSLGEVGEAMVRWVNADGGTGYGGGTAEPHQITSDDGAFAQSGPLGSGATYSIKFTEAGTYHYHCAIHPNMVGTITVGQ